VIVRRKHEVGTVVVVILSQAEFCRDRSEGRLDWRGFVPHLSIFSGIAGKKRPNWLHDFCARSLSGEGFFAKRSNGIVHELIVKPL
jgi:hypothetical protein